jgi:hypothetical protein
MKKLKFLLLASLVAFAACDEDENPVDVQVGSVSVTVTAGGSPLQGVTVSLGAAGTTPQTTSAAGTASFTNVPTGTYTVTLTGIGSDVVCSSTTQPVTVATGQTTSVTFACNIVRTSSISGTVSFSDNAPRGNAAITITRTLPAPPDAAVNLTTNAQGQYSLTGLRSGTYTVTLATTTGCTTAATTQTVVIAAGEARVVNFTCTVAPPPPPSAPATVAIESITFTGAGGQVSTIPDNEIQGPVTVNVRVNEGDQRVDSLQVLLGTRVICRQNFTTRPVSEMELADFPFACPVNTGAFDVTNGVPNFLNGNSNFSVRLFTVAGGTTPAATAVRAITLVNVDGMYAKITPGRTGVSTGTGGPAGLLWWNGNLTIDAMPVMYSGIQISNVTVNFTANDPVNDPNGVTGSSATNLDLYLAGAEVGASTVTRSDSTRSATGAPWTVVLRADSSISGGNSPTSGSRGVGSVEDAAPFLSIQSLRADNQVGPGLAQFASICTDNQVPNPILFPFSVGCANGQPANLIRVDNFASVIDQVDRSLRWAAQYAFPSRAVPGGGCPALIDPSNTATAPNDKLTPCNGVTGWISNGLTFSATVVNAGGVATLRNATAPRVADLGVGLPTTENTVFRAGATAASGTAGATALPIVTGGTLAETVNNQAYFLNVLVQDVFGKAGATTNQRIRWYNNTAAGTGTSSDNITALQASTVSRFGVSNVAPCFTADLTTCADAFIGQLTTDRQVILPLGAATVAPAGSVGGIGDGSSIATQTLGPANSAGGLAGFPRYPVITRFRRMAPDALALTTAQMCYIGFVNQSNCQRAGEQTVAGSVHSGTSGQFDFLVGGTYTVVNVLTGVDSVVAKGVAPGPGYYVVEMRARDNAGVQAAAFSTRTFIRDLTAPTVPTMFFNPLLIAPAGQVVYQGGATDNIDLDSAELYELFGGAALALRMSTTQIGIFGPNEYATENSFSAAAFSFVSHIQVGVGGALNPATGSLFRVSDFGRNYAHGGAGVPGLNAAIPAGDAIVTSAQYATGLPATFFVCILTSCPGTSAPASFSVTFAASVAPVATGVQNPFSRVEFFVGRDANDDGVIDTDGAGNQLWNSLGASTAPSVVGTTYSFPKAITGAQLLTAAGRTNNTQVNFPVFIRAVGFRPNGQSFTVGNGGGPCPAAPGADAACGVILRNN